MPNQHDSLAYKSITKHRRGAEIFAAWVLMVQVASKQDPRGQFDLSPDELGLVTDFPAEIFKLAIEVLKSPKIAWIEESPDTSGKNPDSPPVEEGREGLEGLERHIVPSGTVSKRVASQQFQKPSFDDVQSYCISRGNKVKPQAFLAFYESNGWRVGKNPMRNWKAAIVTWENKDNR